MLNVYYGNDPVSVRQNAFLKVQELEAQGLQVTHIEAERFGKGMISDAVGATSLFGGTELFILDNPSGSQDFADEVKDHLLELNESPNTFVVIEGTLLAAAKKPFQKHAVVMEEFKKNAADRFNTFAFADALARKDKKSLWILLHEARLSGIALEEVIGVLWWQLKTLRLSAITNSAAEAGMKDFPYSKAKRSLSKFNAGELEKLSHSLLRLQHQSRLGLGELDVSLEKWLLTLK